MTLPDLAGLVGVAIVLGAYFLLHQGSLDQRSVRFSAANLLGSVLILVSLCFDFNLPSTVIQVAWIVISGIGLVRRLGTNRRT